MTREHPVWPEAEIINEPLKRADEPRVLVRRRDSLIVSAGADTDVAFFDGFPSISLFTGCGGMDIGLEQAGWTTVLQHEWNECACLTLIGNRPRYFRHAALIQGDIRKTSTGMMLREAGLRVGECYIVTGGPPCQGFSTANSKSAHGTYDQRNDLVFEFLRVVDEAKPRFFAFENVPGFVTFNKKEYVQAFLKRAWDCYYELVYGLVNACEYGVPQKRCRFICMGTRRDLFEIESTLASLPKPEHFGKRDINRLNQIERLPEFSAEVDLIRHAPGVRYFPDREFICNPNPHGHDEARSEGFKRFFDELAQREPDRIVTQPA